MAQKKDAVVLLSGGLDSSTCLYEAKAAGFSVIAMAFDYGQRHKIELSSAEKIAKTAEVKEFVIAPLNLRVFGASALTSDEILVPKGGADLDKNHHIPVTYVPARNLIFLSMATSLAEARGASTVYIGVNALDYSGYPDCRPEFIEAFKKTADLATRAGQQGSALQIITPLIDKTKSEIVKRAVELNVPLELTWSCYDPVLIDSKLVPCGQCDSCILREKGFHAAGYSDPALPNI